jgi:hypothetical protein
MAYLGVKVGENLLFACRNKSNFTLKNINKILSPLDSAIIDSIEGSILDGVAIIKRWFAGKKTDEMHEIEKFKNNLIVIVSHTNDDILAYNCAKALKKDGYKNTFLLRGGMLDLQSKCIPLSKK